ncbi:MAG: DUF5050 domain-containing protein [Cellulosilyticaceae bacterium]
MKGLKKMGMLFLAGSLCVTPVFAKELSKQSLKASLGDMRIYPEIFSGKYFVNGEFVGYDAPVQKVVKKDNKVWLPVRMSLGEHWDMAYNGNQSPEVTLLNQKESIKIKTQLGDKKATKNGQPITLVDPIEKMSGSLMISEATYEQLMGSAVTVQDGLVLFAPYEVELVGKEAETILAACKQKVTDTRKQQEKYTQLITKYNDNVYYSQYVQDEKTYEGTDVLWVQRGSAQPEQVKLLGKATIFPKPVGDAIYYTSTIKEETLLYSYSLVDGKSTKLANMSQDVHWNEADDSIQDIRWIDGKCYIRLHYFDWTMGGEEMALLENGKLRDIGSAKAFLKWDVVGDNLYYIDSLSAHGPDANNLFRKNLTTGEVTQLGDEKTMFYEGNSNPNDLDNWYGEQAFEIHDGKLFAMGFDLADEYRKKHYVYSVDLATGEQKRVTVLADQFRIIDQTLYYIDGSAGYLVRCDLDGGNKKTLIQQKIKEWVYQDGSFYYTYADQTGKVYPGVYKYHIASGNRVKVSDHKVCTLAQNTSGIYYITHGYDEGIYKMTAKGNICLVRDTPKYIKDTGKVLLYTLAFEPGVFVAK